MKSKVAIPNMAAIEEIEDWEPNDDDQHRTANREREKDIFWISLEQYKFTPTLN